MIQDQLQAALANRYQVERELGRGGMATVFLATDIRHDRQVAIKVLHPELAATIGTERFEREIRLAAKLQHPHILGLIDSGAANGLLYYVMPFVEGESVRDKLDREKQLSVDEAVQITLEVADALGYAHAQSIVHRDIKPENVMMSNGHALVADFGIARARNDAGYDKLTLTGIAVGTPTYMSPEQATGENVGPAADLYSLGCMLYEMLAGEPPFSGPNPMAIMARHAMEAVPSIRIIRSSVPEEVEEAILAAMEKNVADRPKTAADFSEILGTPLGATVSRRVTTRYTARHRVPTAAMLTTSERRAARPWWRRPGVIAASFAVLAAGSIAAWSVLADTSDATPALDARAGNVAVLYFDSPDPAFADVADRLTEALIRDLSEVDRDLKVVSQAGVSQFRGSTASRDSIARVLEAGTLVTGEVVQRGDFVEVNTRVYDASGAPLDPPKPVRVAQDSLFQAEEKVAREVAENLRRQLGMTFSIREARAGAGNATSWRFYSRADRTLMQAQDAMSQVHNASDRERVSALFDSADSLARLSRAGDEAWIDPLILRSEIALRRRGLESDPAAQRAWLDSADVFANRALAIDPRSGKALVLRGQVTYARSSPLLATDAKLRAQLLDSAQKQLEVASSVPDVEAEAYATLSYLHFDKKDVASSLIAASKAFEADRFLTNTSLLLNRMFWGYYNTQAFERAWNSCDEGARRFPTNAWFAECALWLELNPRGDPDTAAAWRLKAKVDSLTSEPIRQLVAQMIVAGVIGRVGKETKNTAIVARARQLLDEAAASGRADARIDPRGELPGYEAIMLVQMGDIDGAIDKLRSYVAANPDHSFRIDGDVHWWWRDLDRHPGFKALLDRTAR